MKTIKSLFVCLFIVSIISCSKDDDGGNSNPNGFDGSVSAIEDYFSPAALEALIELGFQLNQGNNPPNIEGTFHVSPYILENSSVPGDYVGQLFADLEATFSEQNNNELTVAYSYINGPEDGTGLGAFISGNGNNFSVFVKTRTFVGDDEAESAQAFSGTMTPDGIRDFQSAILMLDNFGNPSGYFIANNTGRLIVDGDGFSEKR